MRIFSLLLSVGILTMSSPASFGKDVHKRTGGNVKTYKTTNKKIVRAKPVEKRKYKSKEVQDFMDGKTNKLNGYDKF